MPGRLCFTQENILVTFLGVCLPFQTTFIELLDESLPFESLYSITCRNLGRRI